MKNEPKKNSGIPLIIIAGVFVVAIVGIYFLYNSSKTPSNSNTNRAAANQNRNTQQLANAPAGAQPPNMLGSPTASVTVEEFADFQCPSCGLTHPIVKEIQQIYGNRIKFIFRNFPLQMHDKGYDAAVAAEAAGMQGADKFWAMHNERYATQKSWANMTPTDFRVLLNENAKKLGLDVAKFQTDMAGLQTKTRVNEDMERGRALNVNSTPTIYIDGVSVPYPEMSVQSLRQLIDAELQRTAGQKPAATSAAVSTPAANTNETQKPESLSAANASVKK
ncbi:MAG: thioredoxin domain-containing protein [Pyrinomonadaceae bacterium]